MKKLRIVASVLLAVLYGCTANFGEINQNPGAPTEVRAELLLRKVLFDHAEQMSYEGFVAGNLLGQLFTAIDFNLFDRHGLAQSQYGGNPWSFLYRNLRDTEILLNKARTNALEQVYEGPALVLKAYFTAQLTDLYGDVPYTEALKGKAGNVTPKYDSQRDIYLAEHGILNILEKAVERMKAAPTTIPLRGDIIYRGDLSRWIKFANALRFKYLIRISGQENVAAQLQSIFESGEFILKSADDAIYQFTVLQPNNFRMGTARIGDFSLFIMSKTAEEKLKALNDPRMAVFFRPTGSDPKVFKGLLNGPDASKLSISLADYSLTGRIFREDAGNMKANFMTSFEMNFLLAEAAEKGWIKGDAKGFYEEGVKGGFAYWRTDLPADYLVKGPAAYRTNKQSALEQIITQKWLANIVNGYEGWNEYRRTGFPALKQVSASLNDNHIPVRLPYPPSESTLNKVNFDLAAGQTDGNSINAPVWWDKE